MKTVILIKQHPCVQIAHVYEHLFMQRLNEFLYENRLFKYLDYFAHGMTFEEGGMIVVECGLYTDEAITCLDDIKSLNINLGDDGSHVYHALMQITAEESYRLSGTNKQKIMEEVTRLDASPWQSADATSVIDTKSIRRRHTPLSLTREPQPTPRQLHISLRLDVSFAAVNRKLVALSAALNRFLLLSITNQVTKYSPLYPGELYGSVRANSMTSELLAAPSITRQIDIESLAETALRTIHYMYSSKGISRFARYLKNASYQDRYYDSPDIEKMLNETGVFVGSKGWQEIADDNNSLAVLRQTTLVLTLGRKKVSYDLSSFTDLKT